MCDEEHGSFLVRLSSNKRDFVICVNDDKSPMHFQVKGVDGKYKFAGRMWDELTSVVREELREILGIVNAPTFATVARYPESMPQYEVGHLSKLEQIEAHAAAYPTLALAGNGYRGVGIPDCIASGEKAAEQVFSQQVAGLASAAA